MKKIAVLIPCYNEEQTIEKVVKDFRCELPEAEIYVYDNNSTDNTYEIAKSAGAIVKREPKQGKGNVVKSMFEQIEADCYIMVDGDDTYPVEYARQMVDLIIDDQVDMVIGDRLSTTYNKENKRLFHSFGNNLVSFLVNSLFRSNNNQKIKDIMTGYRAFSTKFVKNFKPVSEGFQIETEITIYAKLQNYSMKEIQIKYRNRPKGSISKLNTIKDGIRVIQTIFSFIK